MINTFSAWAIGISVFAFVISFGREVLFPSLGRGTKPSDYAMAAVFITSLNGTVLGALKACVSAGSALPILEITLGALWFGAWLVNISRDAR